MAQGALEKLRREFEGRIRYEYRDFPLRRLTFRAAEAARCAADQGKAEGMRAMLFSGQGHWALSPSPEDLWAMYAKGAGADVAKWRACVRARAHSAEVEADRRLGLQLGVDGTPTFFVGRRKVVGAVPYEELAAVVRAELRKR